MLYSQAEARGAREEERFLEMKWRETARLTGAVLAAAGVCAFVAHPAAAQGKNIERRLAGIRLNASSKAVLAAYGNPNEVVIGDVGPRTGGTATGGAFGGGSGGAASSGQPGGFGGRSASLPAGRGPSAGATIGSAGANNSVGAPTGFTPPGAPPGYGGAPSGFGGPPPGFGGAPLGGGGEGDPGGVGFGGGAGTPPSATGFGQTTSTLARQQEVTWIYNRRYKDNLISYEFLIGPNGNVSQIRVTGYNSTGGNVATQKGIGLGRTYRDVIRVYGFPEEHYRIGRVLVASYRRSAHVQFQFLNEREQSNPLNAGNKCIAITIATVE